MLSGCASTPQSDQLRAAPPPGLPREFLLEDVAFHPQERYQCGPASLAMALNYSGIPVQPDALVNKVYVPAREGSFQVEMLAATRSLQRIPLVTAPDMPSLLAWVASGQPVLVLQNLGLSWYPKWHYAVVIGYDLGAGKIILHSGITPHYAMGLKVFERTWQRGGFWGMAVLTPGELPPQATEDAYFLALAGFERSGEKPLVATAWRAGLARWPDSRNLLMGYGNFLHGERRFAEAIPYFENVVGLYPEYAPAYNNLADALVQTGEFERAAALAKKAVTLDPGNRSFYEKTLRDATRGGAQASP